MTMPSCHSITVTTLLVMMPLLLLLLLVVYGKLSQKPSIQFLGRPHDNSLALTLPHLDSPAAWTGRDLQKRPHEWTYYWTEDDLAVLERAVGQFKQMHNLSNNNNNNDDDTYHYTSLVNDNHLDDLTTQFPLSLHLQEKVREWQCQVDSRCRQGRGFQLIKGLPVHRWSKQDTAIVYQILGLYLGNGRPLIDQGDDSSSLQQQVLVHVRNEQSTTTTTTHVNESDQNNDQVPPPTCDDSETTTTAATDGSSPTIVHNETTDTNVRLYKTHHKINFHCDGTDVVALLCLTNPANASDDAGASILVSSVAVYHRLRSAGWAVRHLLQHNVLMDTRGLGGVPYIPLKVLRLDRDGPTLRTFYHQDYFASALEKYVGVASSHDEQDPNRQALEAYRTVLEQEEDLRLRMQLEPGDIQLVSNHLVLHSRNAYRDAGTRRDLLRMWVSLQDSHQEQSWMSYWDQTRDRLSLIQALLQVKFGAARRGHRGRGVSGE